MRRSVGAGFASGLCGYGSVGAAQRRSSAARNERLPYRYTPRKFGVLNDGTVGVRCNDWLARTMGYGLTEAPPDVPALPYSRHV